MRLFLRQLCFIAFAQSFQNYTVARDSFLSQLGATLRGFMNHVITPSISDGAFHFYKKISFQLYFITQEVSSIIPYLLELFCLFYTFSCFQKMRDIKQLPVNIEALKEGLSSLGLPSQEVLFSRNLYVYVYGSFHNGLFFQFYFNSNHDTF